MSNALALPVLDPSPLTSVSPNPQESKLHKTAHEFEALLVSEMLKSARATGSEGWLGSGEDAGDDTAMDMAESQLANILSRGRGIGLADVIERALEKQSTQSKAETQPENSSAPAKKL